MKLRNDLKLEVVLNLKLVQPVVLSKGSYLRDIKDALEKVYYSITHNCGDGNGYDTDNEGETAITIRMTNMTTNAIEEIKPSIYAAYQQYLPNNIGIKAELVDRGSTEWGPKFGTYEFKSVLNLFPAVKDMLIKKAAKDNHFYGYNPEERLIKFGYVIANPVPLKITMREDRWDPKNKKMKEVAYDNYDLTEKGKNYVLDQFIAGMKFVHKKDEYKDELPILLPLIEQRCNERKADKTMR